MVCRQCREEKALFYKGKSICIECDKINRQYYRFIRKKTLTLEQQGELRNILLWYEDIGHMPKFSTSMDKIFGIESSHSEEQQTFINDYLREEVITLTIDVATLQRDIQGLKEDIKKLGNALAICLPGKVMGII